MAEQIKKTRYALLDSLRGLLLLEMIVYHYLWDLVYLFEQELPWFHDDLFYWWQQSICWRFIFLSGFCWPLGKRPVRRALQVLTGSMLVLVATHVFVPRQAVTFGVLFFLGSAMLLLTLLERQLSRVRAGWGVAVSGALFGITRNINDGYLGFEQWNLLKLPEQLYLNKLTTYVGFTEAGFASSDYFSLLPWFFLYLAGYYSWRCCTEQGVLPEIFSWGSRCLSLCGRRSLLVYLLHQPVLYLLLTLFWHGKSLF
ncbi:heparan-alpha-glucosaminide N-acetyltransferase domain-containing protein [uncultured Phascolarctobacterium sp.]|uniref:heparan-alpha-glucosaminide N-acetyltransferase domain-containing protein n=1 Tax=uncultured Phascolarctobacterium sp. TaxID=512296 RepID=UPI002624FB70|nr:heparan-alpha-glucosaminide N-acetyltransferase domain-containing protein [uncultured Phascolarctobacterium sp.]